MESDRLKGNIRASPHLKDIKKKTRKILKGTLQQYQ